MIWPKRVLGAVALFMGLVILGWFLFNLFHPTQEFRRSFFGIFQLAVPIAFVIYGWRWLRYEGAGVEDTPVDLQCPELVESVKQARQSLPYFIQQVQQNVEGAFVKFPINTPRGLIEHIWGYVHAYQDSKFYVSLANKPKDPQEPASGRREVRLEDVEDWQIMMPDGSIKGAYSLIALFKYRENRDKKLSPRMLKQRAQLLDAAAADSSKI